jgi:hypothetical protein
MWNPSTTTREWIAVCSAMAAIVLLGVFPKTALFAKGLGVAFIVLLLLQAQAITRLQNFVSSIGGPTV